MTRTQLFQWRTGAKTHSCLGGLWTAGNAFQLGAELVSGKMEQQPLKKSRIQLILEIRCAVHRITSKDYAVTMNPMSMSALSRLSIPEETPATAIMIFLKMLMDLLSTINYSHFVRTQSIVFAFLTLIPLRPKIWDFTLAHLSQRFLLTTFFSWQDGPNIGSMMLVTIRLKWKSYKRMLNRPYWHQKKIILHFRSQSSRLMKSMSIFTEDLARVKLKIQLKLSLDWMPQHQSFLATPRLPPGRNIKLTPITESWLWHTLKMTVSTMPTTHQLQSHSNFLISSLS